MLQVDCCEVRPSTGSGNDVCEGCEAVHDRSDEGVVNEAGNEDTRGPDSSPEGDDGDMPGLMDNKGCSVAVEVLGGTNVKVHLLELRV